MDAWRMDGGLMEGGWQIDEKRTESGWSMDGLRMDGIWMEDGWIEDEWRMNGGCNVRDSPGESYTCLYRRFKYLTLTLNTVR